MNDGHRGRRPPACLMLCVILGALTVQVAAAGAQTMAPPDPLRGRQLAERLCVGCHAIDADAPAKLADVPSFPAIANRPGRSAAAIIGGMLEPHPAMPGLPLTTGETRDLAAYIQTFTKRN